MLSIVSTLSGQRLLKGLAIGFLIAGLAACVAPPQPRTFALIGGVFTEFDVDGHQGPADLALTGSLVLTQNEDTISFKYHDKSCEGSAEPISSPGKFLIPFRCSDGESGTATSKSEGCGARGVVDYVDIHMKDGFAGFAKYHVVHGPCGPQIN